MWVRGALAGEGAALFVKEGPAGGAALGSLIPKRLTGFRYKRALLRLVLSRGG